MPMQIKTASKECKDRTLSEESDSGQEKVFSDSFISYQPFLAFPDMAINKKDVANKSTPDLCQFRVRNETDFSYTACLSDLPDWCLSSGNEAELKPGESTDFGLGLDAYALPPGTAVGVGKVVIKRPFIRLAYPISFSASVQYDIPVPLVKVDVLSYQQRKLRIVVTNGGTGILQGYCYNLETRKIDKFYLSSYSKKPSTKEINNDRKPDLDKSRELIIVQSFQNCADKRQGVIIMADCPNPNFRRTDIHPDRYLDAVKFADKSVLHFAGMKRKIRKDITIKILHPSYLKKCKITIPSHLQSMIRATSQKPGAIAFCCAVEDMDAIGDLITGYIDFEGIGNKRYSLPVAISPD